MQYALDFIDNLSGAMALVAAAYTAYMMSRVKNMIMESENRLIARINGTYIRRSEVQLMKDSADKDHDRFDRDIRSLHDRLDEND